MTTRSQISSTSPSRWELTKIVVPSALRSRQQFADLAAADRIDAVGRLVEEDHLRPVQEGLRDAEALLHALGIGADLRVHSPFDADNLQNLGDASPAFRGGNAEQRAVELEQAGAGVIVGKAMVFRQITDAAADAGRADRLAEQSSGAVGRFRDAEEDLDEGRLAGAVLAEQAEDLALLDLQGHALEGLDLAIVLDEVQGFDDRHDERSWTRYWALLPRRCKATG